MWCHRWGIIMMECSATSKCNHCSTVSTGLAVNPSLLMRLWVAVVVHLQNGWHHEHGTPTRAVSNPTRDVRVRGSELHRNAAVLSRHSRSLWAVRPMPSINLRPLNVTSQLLINLRSNASTEWPILSRRRGFDTLCQSSWALCNLIIHDQVLCLRSILMLGD